MVLEHERLDVYLLALDFLVLANGILEALPKPDKRRYYLPNRARLGLRVRREA